MRAAEVRLKRVVRLLASQLAGLTVLMAEQNFTQAMRVADRGYVIVHGEIAVEGTSDELYRSDLVKRYYLGLDG